MSDLRTESKIIETWQQNEPVLLIRCKTYNHEKFIEDAIKGFLIQETNFPIEILIHDDASTDKTPLVIQRYESEYSRIINAIYQSENQYSRGIKPDLRKYYRSSNISYIAICEGDDYWTDPSKLQKQVDFLEANRDYVITGHNAIIVDEKGNIISKSKLNNKYKRDFDSDELIMSKSFILSLTRVYRNVLNDPPPEKLMVLNGDDFTCSLLGHYGKYKYMDDIKPAVYRRHAGGIWSSLKEEDKFEEHINSYYWLYKYYMRLKMERYAEAHFLKMSVNVIERSPALFTFKAIIMKLVKKILPDKLYGFISNFYYQIRK